ncbi:RecQ family ATP-dependent DNA helicase [Vallicoccus soli]|uniref:ATP-dependent DNA helicase RecQ n=1 Tax=Vallicoccus soli TaxID=2339232 RepID=A0A3A3ZME6_9ACTN|nr:ATP-dependent DNA helicase RecQ [Vallicoccus soli]RJK97781.1 RecQ family ATP-dependent DNA helicase [Vallicoccus soli]
MSTVPRDAALPREEALAEVRRVAREVFGYEQLREGQEEAMAALLAGHDVLLVMPTGGGKSAVYQVPAVLMQGPTLVVSPLIALQQDQVEGLREHGAETEAYAVSSATSARERREAWEAVRQGDAEFLFLAPEQLANPEVLERVRALRPSLVAVDEAHAVSSWGHDFRPDYLRLGEFIDALGRPRVIALTATAAPQVRDDIVEHLRMRDPEVVVKGFARTNIDLQVVRLRSDAEKRDEVLLRTAAEAKPLILYTATRRDTEEYAEAVAELGLRAAAYHGGMRAGDREEVQQRFMAGELDVIVATNAFGMGIDKADIRTVVHATVPDSPDSYYQEVGRAGRDGEPSSAVLFYRPEDLGLRRFFTTSAPDEEQVEQVARAIERTGADPSDRDDRAELRERTGLGPRKLGRIVNLLEDVEDDRRGDPHAAAERAVELAEAQRTMERSRLEMMRGYAETTGCRRQFMLSYFGEELPEPCGHCDTCRAGTAEEVPDVADAPFALQERVRHEQFGEGVVMGYEGDPDRVTVLFDESGYRTLALEAVRRSDLLEPAD